MSIDSVVRFVNDLIVYYVNGILVIYYAVLSRVPLLISIALAALLYLWLDPWVEHRSAHTLKVDGVVEGLRTPHYQRRLTLATLILWLVAGSLFPTPVPWLGAFMWLAGITAMLMLPAERIPLTWRVKSMIITYAVVLIGFRMLLALLFATSPEDWAALLGSTGEAQRIVSGNAGLMITIGSWVAWYGLPVAELWYLVQRVLVNPMSLVNPAQTAAEIVDEIRTRGRD